MKELTQERLKELLSYDPDTGLFTHKGSKPGILVGSVAGTKDKYGYIKIGLDYKQYTAHRLVFLYTTGKWPEMQVDHINRKRDDNRLSNLREANNRENAQNMGVFVTNKSGYTGVCWNKKDKRWKAQICVNKKVNFLGYFDTPEEAHEAYKTAKAKLHSFQPTVN